MVYRVCYPVPSMPEDNTTHHGRLHSFPLKPRLKIYDFALVRPNKIVRQGEYKAGKPRSHAKGQKHLTDHRSTVQAFLLSTPDIFSELPALLIGTNDSSPSSPSERTSSEDHDDADTEYREFAVHKVPCIAKKSCRRSCARTVLRVTLAKVSELAHELGIRGSAPNDISATVNSIRVRVPEAGWRPEKCHGDTGQALENPVEHWHRRPLKRCSSFQNRGAVRGI